MTTPLSQNAFTMRLGALYDFETGLAPYLSYSESFEPQAGTTFDGVPFDPVTGRQYEAGIKYQPTATQAIFSLSAYDLRRQKVPVGHPAAGSSGIPANAQIQVGEVAIRGIEAEGRGEVLPGLDVIVTGTYTDAEITQVRLRAALRRRPPVRVRLVRRRRWPRRSSPTTSAAAVRQVPRGAA